MIYSLWLKSNRKTDYIPSAKKIGKFFLPPLVAPPSVHWRWRTILALLFLALALDNAPLRAGVRIGVDQGAVLQEDFQGFNVVHHGFSYLPESREMGMNDTLRALERQRLQESGVRIVRSYYRPDWAMGDGHWLTPDWESVQMRALYAWLADMQRLGIEVALNMGWWFPRDVIWNRDQHLATYPADLEAYCQWLSESVHQIVQVRGFTNVKYLAMFTEPNDRFGDTPHGKQSWEYYKEVLQAAHQRLVTDGRRHLVRLMGPNTPQPSQWLGKAAQELNGVLDVYSTHAYNLRTYQEWLTMAQGELTLVAQTGKPLWIDEYGIQEASFRSSGQYGIFLAQANAAFLNAGAASSFLWLLSDQYYPTPIKHISNSDSFLDGRHAWGLLPWAAESPTPRPAWDAFVMLARLMAGPGARTVRTTCPPTLPAASTVHKDGRTNVLVVNPSPTSQEVTVTFATPLALPLYRYAYQAATPHLGVAPGLVLQAGSLDLHDTLAPEEAVVYSSLPPQEDGLLTAMAKAKAAPLDDNVALRKAVTASSAAPDWPAANLTDGKRLTSWRPEAAGKGANMAQVVIDLGAEFTVRRVEVFPAVPTPPKAGATISLALSRDQRQWRQVPLGDKRPEAAARLAAFPPQPCRYVRVRLPPPAGLGEIKVFGH